MWGNLDLNQGPTGYESAALTAELLPLTLIILGDMKRFWKEDPNPKREYTIVQM